MSRQSGAPGGRRSDKGGVWRAWMGEDDVCPGRAAHLGVDDLFENVAVAAGALVVGVKVIAGLG